MGVRLVGSARGRRRFVRPAHRRDRRRTRHVLHAATFGLWHVRAARIAGDGVAVSVLLTGCSAWLFEWVRRRSGSVVAPALLHLSVNVGGAVAAELAQARTVD